MHLYALQHVSIRSGFLANDLFLCTILSHSGGRVGHAIVSDVLKHVGKPPFRDARAAVEPNEGLGVRLTTLFRRLRRLSVRLTTLRRHALDLSHNGYGRYAQIAAQRLRRMYNGAESRSRRATPRDL